MKITLEGVDKLNHKLKRLAMFSEIAAEKELRIIMLDLQGKAQLLAPIDTGDLRGSAYAEVKKLEGEVGFIEPYALRQHEDMSLRHPRGGQAKYLETPFKENRNKYIDMIGKAIAREMKR